LAELTDLPNGRDFTWHDGDRVVRFGREVLATAPAALEAAGWEGYDLLSTPRALAGAPTALADLAGAVHHVPPGKVADTSAALFDAVEAPGIVAYGGGRVIDTAKAIAAVRGGRVAALPTTLSGAEMTAIHRLPAGRTAPRLVRPELVLADPDVMTELEEAALRATAMNALGHAADALFGPRANPVSTLCGLQGARLIARALDQDRDARDRAALALGGLLGATAIDGAGLSLHHAVCQELVRGLGIPHAEANAALLPHTMEAMSGREPAAIAALAEAVGSGPDGLCRRLTALGGGRRRLSEMGAEAAMLEAPLGSIEARLGAMTEPPGPGELRELVERAW